MAELPEVGVSVVADTRQYDKKMKQVIADANKVDKLDPTITPMVDASALKKMDSAFKNKNVDIGVDADMSRAESKVKNFDPPKADIPTDADTSKADATTRQWVGDLADLNAAIDIVARFTDIPSLPLLDEILQTDQAVKLLNSRISGDLVDAAGTIDRLWTSNWGDSKIEIAENLALVNRTTGATGSALESQTATAFEVASVNGQEFADVLESMQKLVDAGLFKDFQSAGNFITAGFQNGLDKSGDFLESINEYSVQFADMGLSAEGGFSAVQQALNMGAFDADKVVDLFKELNAVLSESLVAGEGDERFDLVDKIGQTDELGAFVAGELTGDEFFSGFLAAVGDGLASGKLKKGEAITLLGSQAEDLTISVAIALDPLQVAEELANIPDDLTTLEATLLFSDVGSKLEEARRVITTDLAQSVSEAFDIPGKIDQFTDGVSELSGLIAGGTDIPEAIEIAFQLDGFAQTVANLESGLANFLIGLLEFLSGFQTGEAREQTLAQVTTFAAGQLPFDLTNAEDIAEFELALSLAAARGVSNAKIGQLIQDTINEELAEGDLEGARKLADFIGKTTAESLGLELSEAELGAAGVSPEARIAQEFGGLTPALRAEIENAEQISIGELFEIDTTGIEEDLQRIDTFTEATSDGFTETGDKAKSGMQTAESGTTISSRLIVLALAEIAKAQDAIIARANAMSTDGIIGAANQGAVPPQGGGLPTGATGRSGDVDVDIPGEASGGVFQGSARIHPGEIMMTGPQARDVAVLNAQTSSTVLSGLGQLLGGMGLGTGPTTNNSRGDTNITINSASAAEDVQALNATTNAMRGF